MISFLSSSQVKTLIIADDDPDDQVLLKESMEGVNHAPRVKTVFDGAALMQMLRTEPAPDLVLLDLNMPNKNGIECLREIRTGTVLKSLPVVVLSTSNNMRDIEKCYDSGADLFFCKPNSFPLLQALLNSILCIDWKNFPESISKREFIRITQQGIYSLFPQSAIQG